MEEIKDEIQKIQELVEAKKLNELREILNDMNSVDISVILEELSEELDKEKILKSRKRNKVLAIVGVVVAILVIGVYLLLPTSIPLDKSKNFSKKEVIEKGTVSLKMLSSLGLQNIQIRLLPASVIFEKYITIYNIENLYNGGIRIW